jgi:glutathione peroxidase-family protein
MKAWILFDENNNFVSKCFDKKFADLDTLGAEFDKSKCKYVECDCCDDDYVYYENGEMKMKKFDKEVAEKMDKEYKIRFKIEDKISVEEENKNLKNELDLIKELLRKNNII